MLLAYSRHFESNVKGWWEERNREPHLAPQKHCLGGLRRPGPESAQNPGAVPLVPLDLGLCVAEATGRAMEGGMGILLQVQAGCQPTLKISQSAVLGTSLIHGQGP